MRIIRIFLQSVGVLSLILLAALAIHLFRLTLGPHKITDKDDALFVLNWGGLDTAQNWSIIDGSTSARSMGDHVDYHCIQLQDTSINQPHPLHPIEWQRGPERNELLSQALEQAIQWAKTEGAECFPSFAAANSPEMKILFRDTTIRGRTPAGAQILLLQPATKRLFYISFDT